MPYGAWLSLQLLVAVSSDVLCQSFEIRFYKRLRHPEEPTETDFAGAAPGDREFRCSELPRVIRNGNVRRFLTWTGAYGFVGGTITYLWYNRAVPGMLGAYFQEPTASNFILQALVDALFCPAYALVTMCGVLTLERHDIAYITNKVNKDGTAVALLLLLCRLPLDVLRAAWGDSVAFNFVQTVVGIATAIGLDFLIHRYQPQALPDLSAPSATPATYQPLVEKEVEVSSEPLPVVGVAPSAMRRSPSKVLVVEALPVFPSLLVDPTERTEKAAEEASREETPPPEVTGAEGGDVPTAPSPSPGDALPGEALPPADPFQHSPPPQMEVPAGPPPGDSDLPTENETLETALPAEEGAAETGTAAAEEEGREGAGEEPCAEGPPAATAAAGPEAPLAEREGEGAAGDDGELPAASEQPPPGPTVPEPDVAAESSLASPGANEETLPDEHHEEGLNAAGNANSRQTSPSLAPRAPSSDGALVDPEDAQETPQAGADPEPREPPPAPGDSPQR
eukprot:EG_transcript_8892